MSDDARVVSELGVEQPFPGLRPFLSNESEIFYGRGEHIDQMLTRLEDQRFLAVVGSSGSGKSSLVRAGLLPALEQGFLTGASPAWTMLTMRPGGDPFGRLAGKLEEAFADPRAGTNAGPLAAFTEATLRSGPKGLIQTVRDHQVSDETNLLLLVDQFEEIFRFRRRDQSDDSKTVVQRRNDATAFVNLLLATAEENRRPVYVVITMRSDFIGDCDAFYGLPEAVSNGQFLTPRLGRSQMEDAIRGPLDVFGWSAEDAMVTAVLNDTGNELDQLPLMQHALMRTWHRARGRRMETEDRVLTLEDYQAVGGLKDALFRHAEEAWNDLENERLKWIAQVLFRCLSERSEKAPLTRRIASATEVSGVAGASIEEIAEVVKVFCRDDRNFLVINPPGELGEASFLDISHEALMRQWKRFGTWLNAEGRSAEMYRSVVKAAEKWKKGEASLWRPPELDNVIAWLEQEKPTQAWTARYGPGYEVGKDFVAASRDAHEANVRREKKRERKLQLYRWAMWTTLVLLSVFMFWSQQDANEGRVEADVRTISAEEERKRADSQALALSANAAIEKGDPELATLLAMEALLVAFEADSDTIPPQIENSLRSSVAASLLRKEFRGEGGEIRAADYHPSEPCLATGSEGGVIGIWNTLIQESRKELAEFSVVGPVTSVQFSPVGDRLIVTSKEEGVSLWNVEDLTRPARSKGDWAQASGATCAVFRPGGRSVAVGTGENGILLVSVDSGEVEVLNKWEHENAGDSTGLITSLSFDATGDCLLSTSSDGTAKVWNVRGDPEMLAVLDGRALDRRVLDRRALAHFSEGRDDKLKPEKVQAGDFSPSGDLIATVGYDDTLRIWEAATGRLLASERRPYKITDVEFISDRQLATASLDARVRVWNIETAQLAMLSTSKENNSADAEVLLVNESAQFRAHGQPISQLSLSSDRGHLATASKDGTARVWKLPPGGEVSALSNSETSYWSADLHVQKDIGVFAFTGTIDGGLHRWDAYFGELLEEFSSDAQMKDPSFGIRAVSVSPDGSKVVTASNDGRAIVWDAEDGRHLAVFEGHQKGGEVYNARFHPDGTRVITAGEDGTARIWKFSTEGKASELVVVKLEGKLDADNPQIFDARFNPDGTRFVTADYDQDTGTIWDSSNGDKLNVLRKDGHTDMVMSAAFSPDGAYVVTASIDRTCRIWDAETGKLIGDPIKTDTAVRSAEFSPDGKLLLTATNDGIARLWTVSGDPPDVTQGFAPHTELRASAGPVTDARFSRDGTYIITSSRDGAAKVFFTSNLWGLYEIATQRVSRKLTLEERERFGVTRELTSEEKIYYEENERDGAGSNP